MIVVQESRHSVSIRLSTLDHVNPRNFRPAGRFDFQIRSGREDKRRPSVVTVVRSEQSITVLPDSEPLQILHRAHLFLRKLGYGVRFGGVLRSSSGGAPVPQLAHGSSTGSFPGCFLGLLLSSTTASSRNEPKLLMPG